MITDTTSFFAILFSLAATIATLGPLLFALRQDRIENNFKGKPQ